MTKEKKFLDITIKKAGKIALQRFGRREKIKTKEGKTDFVTATDLYLNKMISDRIKAAFPEHGIISEEDKEHQSKAEYKWIVDPIDGTNNYATGIPLFGVMIAFTKNEDILLSGVYLPITNQYFYAIKGKGAFLGKKKLSCTQKTNWPETFGLTTSFKNPKKHQMNLIIHKMSDSKKVIINSFGCMAVTCTSIASGKRDWLIYDGGKIWDRAPAVLLMRESGLKVTNFKGQEWVFKDTKIIAANPILHKKLLKLV